MNNRKTVNLRTRINRLTMISTFLGAVIVGSTLVFQNELETRKERQRISDLLMANMDKQSQQILPLVLLNEQAQGLPLFLDRIKREEKLEAAYFFPKKEDISADYSKCSLESVAKICAIQNSDLIVTSQALATDGQVFGYFFKVKSAKDDSMQPLMAFEVPLLTGFVMAMLLFFGISRITAHEVPDALAKLIMWIKSGKETRPELPFMEFNILAEQIGLIIDEKQKAAAQARFNQLAVQVAHDIRSPLTALNMISSTVIGLSEDQRLLIRNATNRINDIANDLYRQARHVETKTEDDKTVMIVGVLDYLISEKRAQFQERREIRINADLSSGYGLFTNINASELSRSISNLINNSVEAWSGIGELSVGITVSENSGKVIIKICDNGSGIPFDILKKLGISKVTFGKENGSGLGIGILHTKGIIESAGGSMKIESKVGKGTTVTLSLPKSKTPIWFLNELVINNNDLVISLDDDTSIHQVWTNRLAHLSNQNQHLSFLSPGDLIAWFGSNNHKNAIYLIDYEFIGIKDSGLEVIAKYKLQQQAVLVTSQFEDKNIQERARKLGVKILPKSRERKLFCVNRQV